MGCRQFLGHGRAGVLARAHIVPQTIPQALKAASIRLVAVQSVRSILRQYNEEFIKEVEICHVLSAPRPIFLYVT